MPLRYTEDPAPLASVYDVSEKYIIFYSSRDEDGKMWCPVRIILSFSALNPSLTDPCGSGLSCRRRYRREDVLSSEQAIGADCMGGTESGVRTELPTNSPRPGLLFPLHC
jgi:hypothetical protein